MANKTNDLRKEFLRRLQRSRALKYALRIIEDQNIIAMWCRDSHYRKQFDRARIQRPPMGSLAQKEQQFAIIEKVLEKLKSYYIGFPTIQLAETKVMSDCALNCTAWNRYIAPLIVKKQKLLDRKDVGDTISMLKQELQEMRIVINNMQLVEDLNVEPYPSYSIECVIHDQEKKDEQVVQALCKNVCITLGRNMEFNVKVVPSLARKISEYPTAEDYHVANAFRAIEEAGTSNTKIAAVTRQLNEIFQSLMANGNGIKDFEKIKAHFCG